MGGIYALRPIMSKTIRERVEVCHNILKNDQDDSLRVEALWIFADTLYEVEQNDPIHNEIGDLLEWVLYNDPSEVVKHEVCYLIGEHNFRSKIPNLKDVIENDPSELVKHEAIEALGLIQDFTCKETLNNAKKHPSSAVRNTAKIVQKQLERAEKAQSLKYC